MSHQSATGNSDETNDDQCSYDGQCMLRIIDGRRSVPD